MKKLWKFLRTGLESDNGMDRKWEINKWKKEDDISICNKGFHASRTPLQALNYVPGEILAQVEVRGKSVIEDDKECWSEMRAIKAWHWKKEDSVALSIFAAELCIKNYEDKYPNDPRPRNAIKAAKKWLAEPTEENRSVARSVARSAAWSAAWSAEAAWSVARSVAWSAEAAEAAWSAAEAAEAAEAAAWSAEAAARSAAEAAKKELIAQLNKWFIKRIKKLEKWTK